MKISNKLVLYIQINVLTKNIIIITENEPKTVLNQYTRKQCHDTWKRYYNSQKWYIYVQKRCYNNQNQWLNGLWWLLLMEKGLSSDALLVKYNEIMTENNFFLNCWLQNLNKSPYKLNRVVSCLFFLIIMITIKLKWLTVL